MDPSKQSEQKMNEIVDLLNEAHQKLQQRRTISMIIFVAGSFFIGLGLLILVEKSLFLSAGIKTGALGFILLIAVWVGYLVQSKTSIAPFQQFYDDFLTWSEQKSILSAVDLYLNAEQKVSRFYEAAIASNLLSAEISKIRTKLDHYLEQKKVTTLHHTGVYVLISSVLYMSFLLFSYPAESVRTITFWNTFIQPNPFHYTVTPGDTILEVGTTLQVGILFSDDAVPDHALFMYKTDLEEVFRERPMRTADITFFQSQAIELNQSIDYRFEMDGFKSDTYRIDVQHQPRFDDLVALITPPPYTGLQETKLEYPFTQINLYRGSELTLSGRTNKPMKEVSLSGIVRDRETVELNRGELETNLFTVRFTPETSDTLRFHLEDTEGIINRNPFRILLNVRDDQYPSIMIEEPTGTVMMNNPQDIEIFYRATDDFGLTRAQLQWEYQRAFVDVPEQGTVALQRPVNGRNERYLWVLSDFDLKPRDQIVFRIRVWDNDEISGHKMSESQPVIIQIPSLTEYFEELDSQERDVQSEMDQISESFQQMEEEYQEFLERMKQNPEGGFEEQQFLEDIRNRQEIIDEAVQQMNEKFDELRSEMEQNNRLSEETQRAYRELQQLMDELDDPALREAMEELQRALESMSQQDLERALENLSFNENLYRERLQRTAELFKQLKMNSDLDKLASQYEDMAERIRENPEESIQQLNNELQNLQDDLDSVSEQLDRLDSNPPARSAERLRQIKEEGQRELESIREQVNQVKEQIGREQETGESTPSEEVQDLQEQIREQMMSEAKRFRTSIEQMSGQQIQVNIIALQRALYTLLELSDMQEYLTQMASETRTRSLGFVDLARQQKNISDQFTIVADTIFQVSAELPGIPNQVNRRKAEVERVLGRSMDQMIERNQRGSGIASRESLGGINDLTSMIATLIDQIMNQQNGGAGGGMTMQQMIEQMQNMSQDQQLLNQQLQDLINDAQGERLTREQSDRLDQIARQQNEIRRQMQELQQRGALDHGDSALSELQRMMEEMEDSINDMRGGITDPIMIQRQQNILSRMLSAEQSLQQRGEEDEREGTAATEYNRVLPPNMTLEELEQEIRARMQDPNYTRFSEEYQRLIERYFERLRQIENLQR